MGKKPTVVSDRDPLRAKLILYSVLVYMDEETMRDDEVDLLFALSKDKDVQEYLSQIGRRTIPVDKGEKGNE